VKKLPFGNNSKYLLPRTSVRTKLLLYSITLDGFGYVSGVAGIVPKYVAPELDTTIELVPATKTFPSDPVTNNEPVMINAADAVSQTNLESDPKTLALTY
jgi:hypothetical protein